MTDYKKTCSDCIFANWDGQYQSGCRVRPLIECDEHTDSGHWNLGRMCHFKREDKWLQSTATKTVRKEVVPTYCVCFDMENNPVEEIFDLFHKNNCRLPPGEIVAYTKNSDIFYDAAELVKKYDKSNMIRLMREDTDPALEVLRNTRQKYVWMLSDGEIPYKDLFWWIDRQVNDLEWRYGLIDNIWPVALFKMYPGHPLELIKKKIMSEDNLYYEYDFITKCAKSDYDWFRERASFVAPDEGIKPV